MNSQELETAIRLKLSLTVLVLRDNGYGMVGWKQTHMRFDRFGLDFGNPDFTQYAESYGAHGYQAESVPHLSSLMQHCLTASGLHVIDVPVNYAECDIVLTDHGQAPMDDGVKRATT